MRRLVCLLFVVLTLVVISKALPDESEREAKDGGESESKSKDEGGFDTGLKLLGAHIKLVKTGENKKDTGIALEWDL